MAVRSLGQLTLDLVTRIGGFTGPLKQAERAAKRDMTSIAKSVRAATATITATAGAAAAASGAILALTKTASDNARELRNQANVASAGVEEFQRWAIAAKTVSVEQDQLSGILQDVNDRLGDFFDEGSGEMARFFERIAPQVGVTAEQFRKLSGPQALQLYFDSLQKANLSQAEMTTYMERISSDATRLIPLLRNSGEGLAEIANEADRLGLVLSDVDVAQLEDMAWQFDRILGLLSQTGQVVAAELSPYLSVLADDVVDAADAAGDFGEAFSASLRTIVEGSGPVLDSLDKIALAAKGLRTFAYTMGQAYTTAYSLMAEGATRALDFIAGGLNEVIEGFNHLPGVDVPLIGSFNDSPYMQAVRGMADEMGELAGDARAEFMEAFNAPPPSEALLEYLDRVDAKRREIAEGLGEGGLGNGGGGGGGGLVDPEAAERAAKEAERQRKAYESLLDSLYPLQAAHRQFREELELLAEADAAGAVDDLADAQERLRTQYSAELTGGFMEQISTGGIAEELESTQGLAEDLGLTFTSAFEDAVIGGESFRDVLGGIADDLARLALRKAVTEPAIDAIGGIDWGSLVGGFFGGGGGGSSGGIYGNVVGQAHDGIDRVPATGTWNLQKGERVVTAATSDKLDRTLDQVQHGSSANVEINVHTDGGAEVSQKESRRSDGTRQIDLYIERKVDQRMRQNFRDGSMTRTMADTYGLRRKPR